MTGVVVSPSFPSISIQPFFPAYLPAMNQIACPFMITFKVARNYEKSYRQARKVQQCINVTSLFATCHINIIFLGIKKLASHVHLVLGGDSDSLKHMNVFFFVMVVGVRQRSKEFYAAVEALVPRSNTSLEFG